MKKPVRKLRFCRDTVQALDAGRLPGVEGGFTDIPWTELCATMYSNCNCLQGS
jgi:hypothetical protein